MSSGQKLIKICATVFAILLAVCIIGSILSGVFILFQIDSQANNSSIQTKGEGQIQSSDGTYHNFTQAYTGVDTLEIDATIHDIFIQPGKELRVDMENVKSTCSAKQNNSILEIEDTSNGHWRSIFTWFADALDGNFSGAKKGTITITVPEGFMAKSCHIDAGTGRLSITGLQTNSLEIDAGTGSIEGKNVKAGYVDLDCGTGSIEFNDIDFTDTNIDSGTGSIKISGRLNGDSSIECGVGSLNIKLLDPQDSYKLDIEKGLGSITLNGSNYSTVATTNTNAPNTLSIEGGVGSINIDFAD